MQVDLGIGFQELCRDRQYMHPSKHDRSGDDQFAPRRAVLARHGTLSFTDILQDAPARGHIVAAGVGQGEPARRADQQPRLQMRFEFLQLAADGGQRHAELATCRGETAGLHDIQQHGHVVEVDSRSISAVNGSIHTHFTC